MLKNKMFFWILLGICVILSSLNIIVVSSDTASAATYDVDILNGGFTSAQPGESVSFLFDVQNTGDTIDDYTLDIVSVSTTTGGDSSLWLSEISFIPIAISNLLPDDKAQIEMNIDVPFPNDLFLIPPGIYEITVQVTSVSDIDVKDTQIFEVNVLKYYWADVQDAVAIKSVDIGESIQYTITIKNKGNDADELNCALQGDAQIPGSVNWGTLTHVSTGQYERSSLTGILLDAGESTQIILNITIPERTDPAYPTYDPDVVILNLMVNPSDEEGISDSVLVTTDINPIYDFDFTFLADYISVPPGESAEFTLRIENKGTESDSFTYEIYQWEEDWSAYGFTFSPPSITISSTTIDDVALIINTPSDLENAQSKEYDITIRVHSAIGDVDIFRICTVFLDPVYSVDVKSIGATVKAVEVGNSVTYDFAIANLGNSQETFLFDIYDLDTSTSGSGDQSNWAKLFLSSDLSKSILSIDLDSQETKTITLIISIPTQDDPNFVVLTSPLEIGIDAISVQEPTIYDSYLSTTTVNPIHSFELTSTAPGNTRIGKPGTSLGFTLQVRNTGTAADSYEFRVMSLDPKIFVAPDPNDITNLNVNNLGTSTASVYIINDNAKALIGTYPIEISANSKAEPQITQAITLYISITTSAGVDLTPGSQTSSGEPGDVLEYTLTILNLGNSPDTFTLSLIGDYKDWGEILNIQRNPVSEVSLATTNSPGYFTEIIVRVTIPKRGETLGESSYPLVIKATSELNDGVSDSAQVSITVESYVDLNLEYKGAGEPHTVYNPNLISPKFQFNLTNFGNIYENGLEIRVDDIYPDWDYSPAVFGDSLEPGQHGIFNLKFEIPQDETMDEYEMQVYVVSSVDPRITSNPITIILEIVKPDLAIYSSEVFGFEDINLIRGKVGETITITTIVHNEGNTDSQNIDVRLYEDNQVVGEERISQILVGESQWINFSWQVPPQEVEMRVEIVPQVESDLSNNEIPLIYLDIRPDFIFEGDQIYFSNTNPDPEETIRVTALILNSGGNAKNVVVKFYESAELIGTDIIDIKYGEVGMAEIEWTVPKDTEKTLWIRAEVDHFEAVESQATKEISINGVDAKVDEGIPLILWALIAIIVVCIISLFGGYYLGRQSRRGKSGDEFQEYEDEMEIEDAMLMVTTLPPPPPPPPPPPEDFVEEDILNGDVDHDVGDDYDFEDIEDLKELYELAQEDIRNNHI